ncbi:MAG: hypothetical protein WA188_20075, partial [Terriglobales bacterium]
MGATGAAAAGFTAEGLEEEEGSTAEAVDTSQAGVEVALMAAVTAVRGEWAEARTAGWVDTGVVRPTVSHPGIAGG